MHNCCQGMRTHHNGHANQDEPTLCYGGSMQDGWGGKFHVGETSVQGVEMLAPMEEVKTIYHIEGWHQVTTMILKEDQTI